MGLSSTSTYVLSLLNEAATQNLATAVAVASTEHMANLAKSQHGLTLHLVGELGAGKTTFVRHFLRCLGVEGRIKSPTYGLAESYQISNHPNDTLNVWHFDFYRLEKPNEWIEAGLQELWEQPVIRLLEWPQKAGDSLAAPNLTLSLERNSSDENARTASLVVTDKNGQIWLDTILSKLKSKP